ncbi:MAG TPA: M13 family metallopeptidase [Candidatus Aquilonibacter sp.]|jgi:putative endopeptidase|nr:M13 family metallopeptidase [Candidatus Aquilonibacter sp.]
MSFPKVVMGLALLISSLPVWAQSAAIKSAGTDQAADTPKLEHFDPNLVDKSLNPCDDFYKYACNKWIAANPIPADQVYWTTGSGLEMWNDAVLHETLEANSKNDPKRTAVQQKIGDYWTACMDESDIEAAGLKPLQPELDRIAALSSKKELALEIAHLHHLFPGAWEASDNQTNAPFFGFTGGQDYDDASKVVAQIDQGGLSLPNRDYYLGTDAKSKETLEKYRAHVQKMFVLAGETEAQAKADAATVLELETPLATAQMDNIKRRDPKNINNKMSLAQLHEMTPTINWDAYLKAVNAPASEHYLVSSPDFFRAEEKLLEQHPLEHWKVYMRWQVIHHAAPYLTKAIADENFDFFSRTLAGQEEQLPRWRRCVHSADRDLGEALGQAYVDRAFPPDSRARTLEMVHGIEHAMQDDIETAAWMTPATKQQAIVKLKGIEDKIGYPTHWRDYSSVKITRESYVGNVEQASAFEFERWVAKIGKPVDRGEWTMTPPTINAYYDPQLNTINFPAGILQPPFFESKMDDSVNYGATGMIIGHELTHGFDDQGRKFDAHGNLRDWWTAEDAKQYDERGKCISDEYTQDVPDAGPGVKQNGLLTQGEDTADNGGIHLALMALEADLKKQGKSLDDKGPDGWTYLQRFFLANAYSWCSSVRPEVARLIVTTNPHSLPIFRIDNVDSNMSEFAQAFGCKAGQKMVRANACRVW